MTSPIDRAFIRAFAKRRDSEAAAKVSDDKDRDERAPAKPARRAATHRVDAPESTPPAMTQWQDTPFVVSSVDPAALEMSSLQVDVAVQGYPEGWELNDAGAADTDAGESPPAPATRSTQPSNALETTPARAEPRPAIRSLRPEQVARQLDDPNHAGATRPSYSGPSATPPPPASTIPSAGASQAGEGADSVAGATIDSPPDPRREPPRPKMTSGGDPMVVVDDPSADVHMYRGSEDFQQPEDDRTIPFPNRGDSQRVTERRDPPHAKTAAPDNQREVMDRIREAVAPKPDAAEEAGAFPIRSPFLAAWETDCIQWPLLANQLLDVDDRFRDAGRQLADAVSDDLHILAITSTYRGEGRTTVAMNLARAAASHGLRVAIVDGDTDNPMLASAAGIDAVHGWNECLSSDLPLDEAAVSSLEEGITILPLVGDVRRTAVQASGPRFHAMLRALSTEFDLVVVDYGPLGVARDQQPAHLPGDAAILVCDTRCTSNEQAVAAMERMRGLGPQSVGVVQNFT